MILWLDNHLSPKLAHWINHEFAHACHVVRDFGLERAPDSQIFQKAGEANAVLITKDSDFAELVGRLGAPPAIVLLTCGNTSTVFLQTPLRTRLPAALALIEQGGASRRDSRLTSR